MSKNKNISYEHLAAVGNFTKNAVKNFESNIVSQQDYLEKINRIKNHYNDNI